MMSQIISQLSELKQPVTDGREIPGHIRWKEFFICRIMKEAFNGLAFTQFLFCAKQHDHNSGETWATIQFAERFKKLNGKVCKPKAQGLKDYITFLEKRIETNSKKNIKIETSKRQTKFQFQFDRAALNKSFIEADTYTLKFIKNLVDS